MAGSCEPCSKTGGRECDINFLRMTVTPAASGKPVTETVRKRWQRSAWSKWLVWFFKLGNAYDIVLQAIADRQSFSGDVTGMLGFQPVGREPVEITAECSLIGRCTAHPKLVFDRAPNGRALSKVGTGPVTYKYYAPPRALSARAGGNNPFWQFFSFISQLLTLGPPHDVRVRAGSCGCRKGGEANGVLLGLVRIYPREEWMILVEMPALGTSKFSSSATSGPGGRTERVTTTSGRWASRGRERSQEVAQQKGRPLKITTTRTRTRGKEINTTAKVERVESSWSTTSTSRQSTAGAGTQQNVTRTSKRTRRRSKALPTLTRNPTGYQFVVAYNGQESKPARLLDVFTAIKEFGDTVKDLAEAIRRVPKWGLTASADVSVLQGGCAVKWGYELDGQGVVREYFRLKLDMVLLHIKLSVSFGFQWLATSGTNVDISATGTVNLTISGGIEVEGKRATKGSVTFVAPVAITLLAAVNVGGWKLVEAKAELKSGFDVPGASLEYHPALGMRFSGKVVRKPVLLVAFFQVGNANYKMPDYEMYPEATLTTFGG